MAMLKRVRKIPKWKIKEVEYLKELISKYKVIGIADLTGLPSAQLQQIRKRLRGKAVLRVTKNTLMKIALSQSNLKNVDEFIKYLQGSNIFVFTNMNPFELHMILEKYKMSALAKPGDKAPKEIIIPAGNTGIPPGPILSVFGKLKIPTKIQEGTIWVSKDTVVAKPGDVISADLASILQKLGIEPIEVGVRLKVVYDNGLIIPAEKLAINLDEYKSQIAEAHLNALKVALTAVIPEPEVLKLAVAKAYRDALAVAVEASYITDETLPHILAKAYTTAQALASVLAQAAPELGLEAAKPAVTEEKKEEKEEAKEEEKKEEEEKVTEEEIATGLEALFG